MVLFNYSTKELTAKIVYYGPGLCGKTTNLQFIFDSLPDEKKGRMLSLSTQTDRTLYFDFLPVELGNIRGMKTRMQLYTVPGQVFYNETRKMVLKGVDGVVFVADSQSQMASANLESFKNLGENLREHGVDLATIPLVLQFNKRDLPSIQPVEEMNSALNRYNAPFYEAIATTGIGVHDTLKAVSKLVLLSLSGDKQAQRPDQAPAPAPPPPPPAPAPPPQAAATDSDTAAWDTEGLDEMLDQMDVDEIQGLLEEVDEFAGDAATGHDHAAAAAAAPAPEAQALDAASPADESSFADLEPLEAATEEEDDHAIWLGEDDPVEGGDSADPGLLDPGSAEPPEETLEAAFEAHERELELEAGAGEEEDLFATPPALASHEAGAAPSADEETLTFESFLAEERGHAPGTDEGAETGDTLTDAPDLVAADGHSEPTLAAGVPTVNGNGSVQVPLTFQVGARTFTWTLTVSLRPGPDARA